MLEELAQVVEVNAGSVVVSSSRASACQSCQAQSNCGQRSLAELFGKKSILVTISNPDQLALEVGQTVVLGLNEQALLKSSLVMYITPIFFLMVTTLLAHLMSVSEGGVILSGLFGLLIGLIASRKLSEKLLSNPDYTPKLLKIAQ